MIGSEIPQAGQYLASYRRPRFARFRGEACLNSTPRQDNHFEQVRQVTQGMQLIVNALPEAAPSADDPAYVSWFAELMRLVESAGMPPIAYADYFDHDEGWEVGWGSGIRHPPAPPSRHR